MDSTQAGSLTGRISWNLSPSVPGFVYQFAKATDLNTFGICFVCYVIVLICFSAKLVKDEVLCLLNCYSLDEMGGRINELEQSINDLRAEMGVESSPSPVPPTKPQLDDVKKEEGSA